MNSKDSKRLKGILCTVKQTIPDRNFMIYLGMSSYY